MHIVEISCEQASKRPRSSQPNSVKRTSITIGISEKLNDDKSFINLY